MSYTILLSTLTLVLLNPDIPCLCKQCRSRSVGFWRNQLIWICTVCHYVCEFISTIWIKWSDWLKIGSGHGILNYSAGQGLRVKLWYSYRYKLHFLHSPAVSTCLFLHGSYSWLFTIKHRCLTLVMLSKLQPHPLLIFSQSGNLIQNVDINSYIEWQTVQIQISWLLQKPIALDLHCLQKQGLSVFSRTRVNWLIVLGFNDTSTLEGHFVSSPREREKRDRRESRGDEREGQGRKRNRNESEETEEIKTFPLYPYPLQG